MRRKTGLRRQQPHRVDRGALLAGEVGHGEDGSGAGGAGAIGMASVRQRAFPSDRDRRVTPALTPASFATSDLPCSSPSDNNPDQPPPRRRQAFRRWAYQAHAQPAAALGAEMSPIHKVIRSTMPRDDSV